MHATDTPSRGPRHAAHALIAPMLAVALVALAGCSFSQKQTRRATLKQPTASAQPGSSVEAIARARAEQTLPPDPFSTPNAQTHWRTARADFQPINPIPTHSIAAAPSDEFVMFGDMNVPMPEPRQPAPVQSIAAKPDRPVDAAQNLRQVSFAYEGSDFDPVVSRDGSRLFFSSTAHSTNSDIFVKHIDGRALTQLTTDPASDMMPSVSPDGRRVAFTSNRSGQWDIYIMGAEGGQAVQLTSDQAPELHPTWSPDGRLIAFCRLGETSGRWEIWVTEADNPAVRRFLTFGMFPDWHPTENRIAFQRSRDRGDRFFSVWTVEYVNGEALSPTLIASSATAAIINPRWSPDGDYIAVATVMNPHETQTGKRPGAADIWVLRRDGSGRANITRGHFVNLMPAWGPNNEVFFVSNRAGADNIWSSNTQQAMFAAGRAQGSPYASTAPSKNHGSHFAPRSTQAQRPAPAQELPRPQPIWPFPDQAQAPTPDAEVADAPTDPEH